MSGSGNSTLTSAGDPEEVDELEICSACTPSLTSAYVSSNHEAAPKQSQWPLASPELTTRGLFVASASSTSSHQDSSSASETSKKETNSPNMHLLPLASVGVACSDLVPGSVASAPEQHLYLDLCELLIPLRSRFQAQFSRKRAFGTLPRFGVRCTSAWATWTGREPR